MATAEQGGATSEGGAGGKFRKRPFRRAHQTTPYDRPITALRGIENRGSSSWLKKLVVDPASKLANLLFPPIRTKHLAAPPTPPQPPEANHDLNDENHEETALNNEEKSQGTEGGNGILVKPADDTSGLRLNNCDDYGISELEKLLKQKKFSRSEIDRLTKLLQSRSIQAREDDERTKDGLLTPLSDFGKHQQFSSSLLDGTERDRSHGAISTPIVTSKVLEDDISSPAELAKAYMGSRTSNVSPSKLGVRSQIVREDVGLLGNTTFTLRSPVTSLATGKMVNIGDPENGFTTPRARGRSAIYNMARTPYSRLHPTPIYKGSLSNTNGYGGTSVPSSSHFRLENDGRFGSKQMTLKRRSSVLDDDIGSAGPIKRIRQKPNLLAPRVSLSARRTGTSSDAKLMSSKQNIQVDEPKHNIFKTVGDKSDGSIPSTGYTCVPSKSSEVAARILQHLDKLTPKEKSAESKPFYSQEKSPHKLTPSMLHGQALRSLEDVESPKLLQDVLDKSSSDDLQKAGSSVPHDFGLEKLQKVEENDRRKSVAQDDILIPAVKSDPVELSKSAGFSYGTADSSVRSLVVQPPQKKRAFRMSAQEDALEQDDDLHCNGLASSTPAAQGETIEVPPINSKVTTEKLDLVKGTSEESDPSASAVSRKQNDMVGGSDITKERSTGFDFSISKADDTNIQSIIPPKPVFAFDKPKEANNFPPLFGSGPKADKTASPAFSSLPVEELNNKPFTWLVSKPESPKSSVNLVSPATTTELNLPGSERVGHQKVQETEDSSRESEALRSTPSNGPLESRPPHFSFTSNSSNDANEAATVSSRPTTSSNSMGIFGTISTNAFVTSSSLVSATAHSASSRPAFKFGNMGPTTALPSPSHTVSELANLGGKGESDTSFGRPSDPPQSKSASSVASSGSSSFMFGLSTTSSDVNNGSQGSPCGTGIGSAASQMSDVVTTSQSIPVSPASSPSFPTSPSSLTNSQVFTQSNGFGFGSISASSSQNNTVGPVGGDGFKFGLSSAASAGGNAVSSIASAAPSSASFGLSSSLIGTNAIGSSTSTSPGIFNFGGNSSASTSGNTAGSFSSGISTVFKFGGSSAASSSALSSVSSGSVTSNIFGPSSQSLKPIFGDSTFTSSSPSTGFSFAASSSSFGSTNTGSMVFSSSTGASSSPIFSFTTASPDALSPSLPQMQPPVFGNNPSPGFAASQGNNDQMDSMAEDPVQSTSAIPVFGQPAVSPSPQPFMFGSTPPSQSGLFQFGGQQNQVAPQQNPSPFQASGSLEFNGAGGSFSLGSGGDKSARKIIRVNKNRNRGRR